MPELLLEILSEEIPARMQRRAAEDLKRLVTEGLQGARLEFGKAEAHATPRRLALVVDGLPDQQPDLREERKGPKVGAPDKAIEGFLRSVGLASLDQCEMRDAGKGGEAWFAVIERAGLPTDRVLPAVIEEALDNLPWPKSMRWANTQVRWVRPIHNIVALFGGEVLELGYDLIRGKALSGTNQSLDEGITEAAELMNRLDSDEIFGTVHAKKFTRGHRFLSPAAFEVSDFADYKAKLFVSKVVLDAGDRRDIIAAALKECAAAENLTVNDDPGLLDEVAGLVEWPVPLLGTIDDAFMDLPAEALTSSMRAHQKYFALSKPDGTLAPRFGFVANMEAADGGAAIVAGNERVLRARLADAQFFWDQDRRMRLADRAPALDAITFHARLGTVAEKAQRVAALAADLTANIPGADRDSARSAALLCKADLATGMVGEFPDLQGVMGRYYALHDGEKPAVADAIAEHYSPLGPNDRCPTAPVSVAVALADKIDTLVGFWLIDEKPTGSKDPYALRRAALGVIRLVLENGLRLNLMTAFAVAMRLYQEENIGLRDKSHAADDARVAAVDLLGFFADRLKVHLRDSGVRHDLIAAVFGLGSEDDLVRLMARVKALGRFLGSDDGENLLVAYRRAANIVRIESRKDKTDYDGDVRPDLLRQDEEKTLFTNFAEAISGAEEAIALENFDGAMLAMAALRRPVDAFFDKVTVNADDPALRENRLRLLSRFGTTLDRIADFSQIEG